MCTAMGRFEDHRPVDISDALWVDGCMVARFEKLCGKVDRFLTWGAAFTTFAQRMTFKARQNAAFLVNVHVLGTDMCAAPKGFAKIGKYLQ